MSTSFLPESYTPPATNSSYMKLQEGENNFRILSSPILGWEYWTSERKPVRLPYSEEAYKQAQKEAQKNPDPKSQKAKHFWAMVVWNYATEKVEILELTQRGIQESLRSLATKRGWGNPVKTYDISIDKTGSGTDTEYTVSPIPPSPLPEEIEIALKATPINLNALFYGEDPFDSTWVEPIDAEEVFDN